MRGQSNPFPESTKMSQPDDRQDDFDRGVKNRRAVLGDAWVDKSLDNATGFNAEFQQLITRYAWNDIWGRPGLDHTTRRMLVLGMTMGLARWEEFELHCRASIRSRPPSHKCSYCYSKTILTKEITVTAVNYSNL